MLCYVFIPARTSSNWPGGALFNTRFTSLSSTFCDNLDIFLLCGVVAFFYSIRLYQPKRLVVYCTHANEKKQERNLIYYKQIT